MNSAPFLVTKLSHPGTSRWHLPRTHLISILESGLTRRLTTLIAAAGHGKTCTLAHFLNGQGTPYLWMQLDPGDSDLTIFLQYLSLGVQQELKGGSHCQKGLETNLTAQQALPLLVADLNQCRSDVAVVLDDFHLIERDSPVATLVSGLMQYCSGQVHFYICSRTALPFSVARMKVIQEAAEITEDDLRFTPGEVLVFLKEMAGLTLDDHNLEQICHLTEGWSAALVLLAAGLKRRGSVDAFLGGSLPADLFSYLADEVFHSLPEDLQRFMEESSILDACSPPDCDALLERTDSASVLARLLNSNLLLTQLGPESFRYHHLLQRFLQERLKLRDSSQVFRLLHKRAGDWFLGRAAPEEAVKYYLRGEWLEQAAGLVEDLAPLWLRTNRVERLRGLLAWLPTETKERYPWISLCEARQALNAGNHDAAMGMARLALRSFQDQNDVRGIIQAHTLLGEILASRQQVDAAMAAYTEAAAVLGPEYRYEEGVLLQRRAVLGYALHGATPAVEEDLRRAISVYVELGDLPGEATAAEMLGTVRLLLGDYTSAIRLLERSAEIMHSIGEPSYEVGINLANAYIHVGRFADALKICEPMLASSSRKMRRAYSAENLLYAYTRMGDFAKAFLAAKTAHAMNEEMGHRELKVIVACELAALYRLSGEPQAAVAYANEAMQMARQVERPIYLVRAASEAVLLHLFHTGNAASAARTAEKTLEKLHASDVHPFERMTLTLMLAIAEFRQSRTESRPEGVRFLQEALAECGRRGFEFFVLHEWHLGLAAVIYSLAYGVNVNIGRELLHSMTERLPTAIRSAGVALPEAEARLVPAAWQALINEADREALAGLLTPADRRRVVGLTTGPAPVRVQCLGALSVSVGKEPVDTKALKKRKSGQLLVLLLAQEGPLPRDQIVDRLWPDLDPEAADTSLRVGLHHLRRLLEPHLGGRSKSRYIQSEGGLIWFSRQPEVQVDLDIFRDVRAQASDAAVQGDLRQAVLLYEAASKSYRGDLCSDDPYSAGLEEFRSSLREQYLSTLDWLGTYYWEEAQDPSKAILVYKQRLAADAIHEPAHQALMRIYLETGQVAAARQQYSVCREALSADLGVAPGRATESLLQLAISMESEGGTTSTVDKRRSPRKT